MRYALGIAGLALLAPLALVAQAPGTPGPGPGWRHEARGPRAGAPGGMMMQRGREGQMAYAPARLLARNGELKLTADQITRLTAIRDHTRQAAESAREQTRQHLDALKTALDADAPDTAAIRTHFLAAHDAMGQARLAMLVADAQAKALLTDQQRAQVTEWRQHRRWERRGPMRGPQGPGGPGGQGAPPAQPGK